MKTLRGLIEQSFTPIERHRTCPQCHQEYYAHNSRMGVCSKECYDKQYNEKIRPLKEVDRRLEELDRTQKEMQEYKDSLLLPENIINRIVDAFDQLTIDPNCGSIYTTEFLLRIVEDFKVYSFKEKIPGIQPDSFYLHYRNYRLTYLDKENIKIEKLN